jgi:transcriptional regulator with XRE-family HTH domain
MFTGVRKILAGQIGKLVKSRRGAEGLTQMQLARLAGVSRTVLSRLETGKAEAVQTDVLDRLLKVLAISPRLVDAKAPDDARKQARLEHQNWLEQQRNRHLRLAIDLVHDEQAAQAMIAKALRRVELWRHKRTCSPRYIERWSLLLQLPPRKLAKAIASLGEWEDALFQNSPWSWAWS